jgi:CHAT domain-containing protein
VFPLILAALLTTNPASAPPLDPAGIVDRFAGSLQGEHPAIDGDVFSSGGARARVAETLERFQCVAIDHDSAEVIEQTGDAATIAVDVDGFGITARGRQLPLPRRWFLRVARRDGVWSIDDASTEEQRIAAQLLATPGDAGRQTIVDAHPEYDRGALGRALADVTIDRFLSEGGRWGAHVAAMAEAEEFAMDLLLGTNEPAAIATAFRAASLFGDASKFAEASLSYAEASGDCDEISASLFTLGNVRQQTNIEEAAPLLKESAAMLDQVDNPRRPLKALHNYAVLQQQRGALPQAFDAALALASAAARYGWREGEAVANLDVADTYARLNREDLAVSRCRRSLELLRAEGNDAWTAIVLFDLAGIEIRLGDTAHGVAHYEEGLALSRTKVTTKILVQNLAFYARALAEAGHIDAASKPLDEALRYHLDIDPDLATEIAAVRLAQHREREAIEMGMKASLSLGNAYFGELAWRTETIIGRARARLGQRRQAIVALRHAVDIIETRRAALPADELAREIFFGTRIEPYHALIEVLVADGRPREALVVAERIKARTLLDMVTFGRANLAHEMTAADAAREAAGVAEVAARRHERTPNPQRIDEARRALDALRAELRWRYPAAAIKTDHADPLHALATLPKDAAVVEYVVEPAATFIFVVRNGRIRVKRIAVTRKAIAREVEALHNAVAARRLDYAAFARRAARSLLRPVEPWIESASRVYVVPDGPTWQVPLSLLPDVHGDPFVAHHQIAYVPSIALVRQPRARRDAAALLALGNPSGARLPDAAREVRSIAQLYGPAAEVYVGSSASGQRFLNSAPSSSVIHIAAHAEVLDDWPMESSLLLSGRSVTAEEILRTPLRCDVTVLAACDTAAGHVRDGEGVIGLSWALLGAGCGNAVVSQWSVDSAATMRLMIGFHRGYAAGLRPAAALRRAEMAMRGAPADAHPFYWAPFIVIASEW